MIHLCIRSLCAWADSDSVSGHNLSSSKGVVGIVDWVVIEDDSYASCWEGLGFGGGVYGDEVISRGKSDVIEVLILCTFCLDAMMLL